MNTNKLARFQGSVILGRQVTISCAVCKKIFTKNNIPCCWKCKSYTCPVYAFKQLYEICPNMIHVTSCSAHTLP